MTNVLLARLNRKHYVTFSFTVGTQICCGKMLLWKNVVEKCVCYLTITKEFHALCLRELIIGIINDVKMPLVKLSDINW